LFFYRNFAEKYVTIIIGGLCFKITKFHTIKSDIIIIASVKKNILPAFLVMISTLSLAQAVSVSGPVTDRQGKLVPFAFVRDSLHQYPTHSYLNGLSA